MQDFENISAQIEKAVTQLDLAMQSLVSAIPLDDRSLLVDGVIARQRCANEDLVAWLARYGQPGIDPALVLEDVEDNFPATSEDATD